MTQAITSARLGNQDVASVILGQSPPSSAYNEAGDGLPFFQGKVDFGLIHPTPRVWCNAGRKFATAGDILISVRAPVGDVNVARDHCAIGRGVAAIRPGPLSDPWFLYFALLYAKPVLERMATGSTFASVNRTTLNDLDIPFLDKSEQAEIGLFLRSLVYQIEQEEQALHTAQALKRAAMHTLFTRGLRGEAQKETEIGPVPESWELANLASVRDKLQYGTSVRCTYDVSDRPVLRIPNIEPQRVTTDDLKYCVLTGKDAAKYQLDDGDLLFIRTNGVLHRLGSCAVYEGYPANALFASYLIRARMRPDYVVPHFAASFFGSELGTSIVAGRAISASDGKFNLNTAAIDSLLLPLPPTLSEQREIVAVLDAIDHRIDLHRRKRAVLEELFKALLHKLMTREIRVGETWTSSEVQVHTPGYWQQGNCK